MGHKSNGDHTTEIPVLTGRIRADCWMVFPHFMIRDKDTVCAQTFY